MVLLLEQNALIGLPIANRGCVIRTAKIVLANAPANLEANEMVRKSYPGIE